VTLWNPIWRVNIAGVVVTDSVLANLTINTGRTNIYEQTQAGYCNIQIINFNQHPINFTVADTVTIELKDSTNTFIPIFGGTIVDLSVTVTDVGNVNYTQTIGIIALGALSRLTKALTNGVLPKEFDGDQMYEVLSDVLFLNWDQVPPSLQWDTYDPTTTWADAGNNGLGDIDRPGAYELAARSSERTDVYSLASAIATSGMGYLYEQANGQIGYADAQHRVTYLNANGYVDLSANHALANGINIVTRTGDIRNSLLDLPLLLLSFACLAVPRLAPPCPAPPCLPCLAVPAEPCPAMPCLTCLATTCQAPPRRASPALPRPALPCLAPPRRA